MSTKMLIRRFNYYLNFGNLHGIRFLGKRSSATGYKLLWLLIIAIMAFVMVRILQMTNRSFSRDIVNINLDSAYLHWTNTFPAVSICLDKGKRTDKIRTFLLDYLASVGMEPPTNTYSFVKTVQSYLFLSVPDQIDPSDYCYTTNGSCGIDLDYFKRSLLPQTCSDIVRNVTYMGKLYENCEDIFKVQQTELGICFIANSLNFYNLDIDQLPLKYDRSNFDRTLTIEYSFSDTWELVVYVHSPDIIPYFNTDYITLEQEHGIHHFLSLKVLEIFNDRTIKAAPINVRKCRFPNELIGGGLAHSYSISSCLTELRIRVELRMCNCTMPTSPIEYKHKFCDFYGMMCLQKYNIAAMTRDLHYERKTQCLPSCIEMAIIEIGYYKRFTELPFGRLTIDLANVPYVRNYRVMSKTKLDLVVGFGGVIGLFFGASMLSIFELFYIWLIRAFN